MANFLYILLLVCILGLPKLVQILRKHILNKMDKNWK
ncbi:hypothetical protein U607_02846 [Staphylococcus aureus F36687]|nr:hypothetical protein U607_02846 [Staphylococcus aureus F36687]EWT80009.1 hypothetical protein V330_02873 [Staphylococcus aureus F85609]EWV01894.1 hypothetical protein U621_02773 [Staphylococcus aureus F53393]